MPDAGVMCCGGVMKATPGACVSMAHDAANGASIKWVVSMATAGSGVDADVVATAVSMIVVSVVAGDTTTADELATAG